MSLEEQIEQHPQQVFERFEAYKFNKDEEYQVEIQKIMAYDRLD